MRATIGLFALVLLAVGVLTLNQPNPSLSAAGGASLRVGVIMAIWWLAYPQAKNVPRWLAVACAVTLFLVMRWPKLLLVALPLLAVLWFLGPRTRGGSGG
ncbi:MAG: hypothetical protein WD063_10560 [Pirellulales bacterium]